LARESNAGALGETRCAGSVGPLPPVEYVASESHDDTRTIRAHEKTIPRAILELCSFG